MNFALLFTLIGVYGAGIACGMVINELIWQKNLSREGRIISEIRKKPIAGKHRKGKKISSTYLRLVAPPEVQSTETPLEPPSGSSA
jgi:hypothetical protein